jgi:hypothetical protein
MKKKSNLVMVSCKKASELIEQKQVQTLSLPEKIRLSIHTKLCKQCKKFEKVSQLFDRAFQKIATQKEVPLQENGALKSRILKSLTQE